MDRDGGSQERVATAVRNAAGFDWHPQTRELLFAGMERDGMGNDAPDDVLAAISPSGPAPDFHWPACHWQVPVRALLGFAFASVPPAELCCCYGMRCSAIALPSKITRAACRQGSGPAELREPGPGQAIADINITLESRGAAIQSLSIEQQSTQAASCSGAQPQAPPAAGWWVWC